MSYEEIDYRGRIREIQSAFVMGYQDRETCIRMFEELLHDYGLLPKEEQLDRTITNEHFLSMLKMAKEHRVPPQLTEGQPQLQNLQNPQAQSLLRDTIKQRCPVCQKPITGLYNRVQGADGEISPVDPPRCQECMTKWIEERFGTTLNSSSKPAESSPSLSVDHSPASPMSASETDFFAQYEKQMKEPAS